MCDFQELVSGETGDQGRQEKTNLVKQQCKLELFLCEWFAMPCHLAPVPRQLPETMGLLSK